MTDLVDRIRKVVKGRPSGTALSALSFCLIELALNLKRNDGTTGTREEVKNFIADLVSGQIDIVTGPGSSFEMPEGARLDEDAERQALTQRLLNILIRHEPHIGLSALASVVCTSANMLTKCDPAESILMVRHLFADAMRALGGSEPFDPVRAAQDAVAGVLAAKRRETKCLAITFVVDADGQVAVGVGSDRGFRPPRGGFDNAVREAATKYFHAMQ